MKEKEKEMKGKEWDGKERKKGLKRKKKKESKVKEGRARQAQVPSRGMNTPNGTTSGKWICREFTQFMTVDNILNE